MKERDLNTLLNNNFKEVGFSHKIADPIGGYGIQNPFDGFSVFYNNIWFWESKLLKGYKVFNFNQIAPHQIDNLLYIDLNSDDTVKCLIIVGVYEPRKFLDIYFFNIKTICNTMKNKKSFPKKELLSFKRDKKFLLVKNKLLQGIENIYDVII